MDAFETLGISSCADTSEVRRAYKALALVHHPDKSTGDRDRFLCISAAFEECMRMRMRLRTHMRLHTNTHTNNQTRDVEVVRVTIEEMLQGGVREVWLDQGRGEVCKACLGTGASDPADFIACLGCSGTGMCGHGSTTCPSCGGVGGCNVSMHRARCTACGGQRRSLRGKASFVNVSIPPGVCEGVLLEGAVRVSHQDLGTPTALAGQPGCSVSMSGEIVILSVSVTLGEMLCGFHRQVSMYDETLDLCQTTYDPSIAHPQHVFKALRSRHGLSVEVRIQVAYPSLAVVAPFVKLLDRMFN